MKRITWVLVLILTASILIGQESPVETTVPAEVGIVSNAPSAIGGLHDLLGKDWVNLNYDEKLYYMEGMFMGLDIMRSVLAGFFDSENIPIPTKALIIAVHNVGMLDITAVQAIARIDIYTCSIAFQEIPVWLILFRSLNHDWFMDSFEWETERRM